MVNYKCNRCDKIFYHKGEFDRHNKRKYPCKIKYMCDFKEDKTNKTYHFTHSVCEEKETNVLHGVDHGHLLNFDEIDKYNISDLYRAKNHCEGNNFNELEIIK